jgi:hypothetical protein
MGATVRLDGPCTSRLRLASSPRGRSCRTEGAPLGLRGPPQLVRMEQMGHRRQELAGVRPVRTGRGPHRPTAAFVDHWGGVPRPTHETLAAHVLAVSAGRRSAPQSSPCEPSIDSKINPHTRVSPSSPRCLFTGRGLPALLVAPLHPRFVQGVEALGAYSEQQAAAQRRGWNRGPAGDLRLAAARAG